MPNLNLVEQLRKRAEVSYADAKQALEATNNNIDQALLYLQMQGKISADGKAINPDKAFSFKDKTEGGFASLLATFLQFFNTTLKKTARNSFTVYKDGERIISLPLILIIVLMFATFFTFGLLIFIGLILGYSYKLEGPDFDDK